ncbi:hypothetical protein HAX54_050441 [Datura stramonium]|uniref:Uncharacterized protein n=1 Tax=Datura stramonium TaxID=4076 RepID=A0ABS8WR52_DATST|nr:hypothetical protein [Datura stramonium]
MGHMESRVNQQGPPCKAKYSWVTDSFSIRSGLLALVHSLATDDTRVIFLWRFFLLMIGISMIFFSQMKQKEYDYEVYKKRRYVKSVNTNDIFNQEKVESLKEASEPFFVLWLRIQTILTNRRKLLQLRSRELPEKRNIADHIQAVMGDGALQIPRPSKIPITMFF